MTDVGAPAVRAFLDGPEGSMETLRRLLGEDGVHVNSADGQWALVAPDLDDLWGVDQQVPMHQAAGDLVRHLNGLARVEESTYRNVRRTGRYERDGFTAVVVTDIGVAVEMSAVASLTASATGGTPTPPAGRPYLDAAAREPALREVLDLVGAPEDLNAYDLWKVLEVIRAQVGGPHAPTATPILTSSGLIDPGEWKTLGDAINNPATSGPDARHARYDKQSESTPMSLEQARERILRLARDWAKTL